MTATELIHSALEAATPHVPRIPVISIDKFANDAVRRMAASISSGEPVVPINAIVIDEPTPLERAYATLAKLPLRPTKYTVRIGDMQTNFTDLTAAKLFAQAVLMAKEQA